jgi:hypothetical protein
VRGSNKGHHDNAPANHHPVLCRSDAEVGGKHWHAWDDDSDSSS